MNNTIIMFDDSSTDARLKFENYWTTEGDVITQTASEENLTSVEINDTGTRTIYIGDNKEKKRRLEVSGVICLTSPEFITVSELINSTQYELRDINKIKSQRRVSEKFKKLVKLGIKPKPKSIN